MILSTHGRFRLVVLWRSCRDLTHGSRTASELKVKRMQGASVETTHLTVEAFRYAIGIDMGSGHADEAADRALTAVTRKLDKTMSVEYTVNELINEATDARNLALMFSGKLN